LALAYFDTIILDNVFERKELMTLLEKFTFEDFKQMHEKWLKSGYMVWFVHGNFTQQTAIDFVGEARKILNLKATAKDTLSTLRCI